VVEVFVSPAQDGASLEGTQVILLQAVEGGAAQAHVVTLDATGHATLALDRGAHGSVSLLALRSTDLRLDSVEYRLNEVPHRLVTSSPSLPPVLLVAAGLGLGVAGLSAFLAWRNRNRRLLRAAFVEGRALLLDPRASPAQAIRAIYGRLLACLETAGYAARPDETARDIAVRATREFRLPEAPMQEMTRLFEMAGYSKVVLSGQQRDAALDALGRLAAHLGADPGVGAAA
jgi:hypothetical protein